MKKSVAYKKSVFSIFYIKNFDLSYYPHFDIQYLVFTSTPLIALFDVKRLILITKKRYEKNVDQQHITLMYLFEIERFGCEFQKTLGFR